MPLQGVRGVRRQFLVSNSSSLPGRERGTLVLRPVTVEFPSALPGQLCPEGDTLRFSVLDVRGQVVEYVERRARFDQHADALLVAEGARRVQRRVPVRIGGIDVDVTVDGLWARRGDGGGG